MAAGSHAASSVSLTPQPHGGAQVGGLAAGDALQPWRAAAAERKFDVALVDFSDGDGEAAQHASPGV